jgi:arylsulfatase
MIKTSLQSVVESLIALALLPAICLADQIETQPPNIILIMADDLGYAELGCYGQKKIKTPNIDALARNGMRFTQFYSGAPVCAPARCMLMTGKHSGHAYIRNNGDYKDPDGLGAKLGWEGFRGNNPLAASEVTIAELLQARGYATGAIGKWGLGNFGTSGDPNEQGFDFFYGYTCQRHAHSHYPKFLWNNGQKELLDGNQVTTGKTHSQERFTAEAIKFLRAQRAEPFFLYLPLTIPHVSIHVPDAELAAYEDLPERDYEHRDGYTPHPRPHAGYAAMVSYLDKAVGEILAELDALELTDNTIVLFTSDNGPTHGRVGGADSDFFESSGPLRGRKGSVYEGGIREPLIVRWPGKIKAGSESDHVAAFWDMLPTLCEFGDVDAAKLPRDIDGISFAPTLLGKPEQKSHAFLYWEFPAYGGQQALRAGDWKLVRTEMQQTKGPIKSQLYNLADDIGEAKDLAAERPEIVTRLEIMMQNAREPSALFPFKAIDP